ncbi:MAG TPA: acetate uptake transporter [Solirubrobacteraceae bacterium]|nr:acetate uptake transporter [Solirubrobacteraceae bacterium]
MEAARVGPGAGGVGAREADVAPAPAAADPTAGRLAGWTPADPGPLGLAGFAGTTFVLSLINANLVSAKGIGAVLGLALAYGGLAQLLAGMWEFRTGNTFGAVAFTSYGAFWISFFFIVRLTPVSLITPHALSAYLWMWGIFTTYMFFASLQTTGAIAVVFLLLAATFIFLAIGDMGTGHTSITHVGGYVGLATAIAAWYASFAAVINSTFARVLLPVVPLRRV